MTVQPRRKFLTRTIRIALFLGFLMVIAVLATVLKFADLVARQRLDRTPWAQRCFRGATRCLDLTVTCHGEPPCTTTLYVSNHVSWCDIPVLGGRLPTRFLSKSEVGQWPLIGWLAREAGTVFIKRGGGRAASVVDQLAELLEDGQSVMVFPEGTTTSGTSVLPFHGRLLQAARRAGVSIQPVSIGYRRDGAPDQLAPFINDDRFLTHLGRLLACSSPRVEIVLHPPIPISDTINTSGLAAALRAQVSEGLKVIHSGALDSRPADNRPQLLHR